MKKIISRLVVFSFLSACASLSADTTPSPREVYARSYMFTQPIFAHHNIEQAGWHNIEYNKHGQMRAGLQVIGLYQQSAKDSANQRYFLLPHKNVLLVAGDLINTGSECRDIRAEWLGLPANFSGRMCINPEQKQYGVILDFNHDLGKYFNCSLFENWSLEIQMPIVHATNHMNLRQFDVHEGSPALFPNAPKDIIEAFDQPAWNFSKIPSKRSTIELAAVFIRLISKYASEPNGNQLIYYSGLVIPGRRSITGEYLFDAMAGYNGHLGINGGIQFNILLNRNVERFHWCMFANLDDTFLIRNHSCRTFGLLSDRSQGSSNRHSKYLSRYMQFNTQCPAEQNVPGVNLLTYRVMCKPFNMIDMAVGFRLTVCDAWEAEMGYSIWGHGKERLVFDRKREFPDNPADASTFKFGIAGSTIGKTASTSTIANQGPDDEKFTPIKLCDLDLESAATGGVLNNQAFGSLSYQYFGTNTDYIVSAGWVATQPQKNSALTTWTVWGKVGGTF